jgi:hypothetical protein
VDGVTELPSDGTSRVLIIDFTQTGNSAKNRVGEDFGVDTAALEGKQGVVKITFITSPDGSSEKIQSVEISR